MAKTYAQSVKLPNLVAVAHPSTKFLSRDGLNVEGRSSANGAGSSSYAINRKDYIKSLMGGTRPVFSECFSVVKVIFQSIWLILIGDSAKAKSKGRDGILVNTDQVRSSTDGSIPSSAELTSTGSCR